MFYNKLSSKYIFFILLFSVQIQFGQHSGMKFQKLTREDGTLSNKIYCILQDDKGFMWFGTHNGLCRYDGYYFEAFQYEPGNPWCLSYNRVNCIAEDPQNGNLWIGTENGLNYFNRVFNTFERNSILTEFNQIPGIIRCIVCDNDKNCWIGADNLYRITGNGKILKYENNKQDTSSISQGKISALLFDPEKGIWIGTTWAEDSGLDLFNYQTGKFEHQKISKGPDNISCLFKDRNNNLWVGTYNNGLFVKKEGKYNSSYVNYSSKIGCHIKNEVTGIDEDENGILYVSVRDQGLICINVNEKSFMKYVPDPYEPWSLSSKALLALKISNSGIIWIGTFNSGINYVDIYRKKFDHFSFNHGKNGLPGNNVRAIFEGSDGNIWIGTKEGGGLSKFDRKNNSFANILCEPNNPNGLQCEYIYAMNEIDHNKLLIGTKNKGLIVMDKQNYHFTNLIHNTSSVEKKDDNSVFALHKDFNNEIWVATTFMLKRFNPQDLSFANIPDIRIIRCFCQEDSSSFWMGSKYNGLYLYNTENNTVSQYYHESKDAKSLVIKEITGLVKDKGGNLWIATDGQGLICKQYNSLNTIQFTMDDGLSGNSVHSILCDNNNNLWMGTSNGISKYHIGLKRFINFTVDDGLQGNEFENYVACKLSTGELAFGGRNGFNIFCPDDIKTNPFVPPVYITGLSVNNKPISPENSESPHTKHILFSDTVTIEHWQKIVTFTFSALNYSFPENNQYAFFLEGYDKSWNYISTKREATYSNLPYGKYILKVKASNNDGLWNKTGTSLTLEVLPPWWRTIWFMSLIVLCVMSSAAFYFFRFLPKSKSLRNAIPDDLDKSKIEIPKRKIVKIKTAEPTLTDILSTSQSEILGSQIDSEFIQKAIEIVHKNMHVDDFNNDAFVKSMNYSRATVYRKIKNITNSSVSDFIRTIRLQAAAELFLNGEDSISGVCYKVGFKNLAYFSTHFKKLFGTSPRKFIKNNLN